MEDILASIKRVIAEDGRAAPARTLRGARAADGDRVVPLAGGEEDVLELQDPVGEGDGLVSDDAASASRQALAALVSVRGAADIGTPQGDGALEAVVREMLKPMLKDWLDQNLPGIVEELVTREIARITGKSL